MTTTISITAVSQADANYFGNATVMLAAFHNNQEAQTFPIKLGTSGGNVNDGGVDTGVSYCCSGTLGALVQRGGQQYILSNNHVLDRTGQAAVGEAISQPALADAGCDRSLVATVAHLSQATALKTSNVDAALAVAVAGAVDTSGAILELGAVNGNTITAAPPASTLADASLVLSTGEPVAKSGRGTGLTCSILESVNTSITVDYQSSCRGSTAFSVTFTNQVIVQGGDFSGAGDSGSLIVTADTAQPVALLFAGNSSNSIGNPIAEVLASLKDPSTSEQPVIVGGQAHSTACFTSVTAAKSATPAIKATTLSQSEITRASAVKDFAASQLIDPSIAAIEVGVSDDAPGQAALVIHIKEGVSPGPIPAQINGVRTKIIRTQNSGAGGANARTHDEMLRSTAAKNRHAAALLAQAGIIGIGVGMSKDSPAESAVIVYLELGTSQEAIPTELDGVRTRLIATDRFRNYGWGRETRNRCTKN
jgi:hypothetical protein